MSDQLQEHGSALLDCNGSISVSNDWKFYCHLVLTVRHHIMQPFGMTFNLQIHS